MRARIEWLMAGFLALGGHTGFAQSMKPDARFAAAERLREEADAVQPASLKQAILGQAAEAYLQCAEQAPAELAEQALYQAARCYFQRGRDEDMARALGAALLITSAYPKGTLAPSALILCGEILESHREWGRALQTWQRIPRDYPSSPFVPEAHFKRGNVFRDRIKNPEEAQQAYTIVIDAFPRSDPADDSLNARAELKEEAEQYEGAVADFLLLADHYPDSPLADGAMCQAALICESRLKDYARAHELAGEFKKKYPHSSLLKKIEGIETRTLKYAR